MDNERWEQINAAQLYLHCRRVGLKLIHRISKKELKRLVWLNSLYTK